MRRIPLPIELTAAALDRDLPMRPHDGPQPELDRVALGLQALASSAAFIGASSITMWFPCVFASG